MTEPVDIASKAAAELLPRKARKDGSDMLDRIFTEVTGGEGGLKFRGLQPLNDAASETIKPMVMKQLEGMLISDNARAIRSLAWLVANPEYLDALCSPPEPNLVYIVITILAWIVFLLSGTLLIVIGFLQAPRIIGYASSGCLGLACLALSTVVFARGRPELAGAMIPPVLPPGALRTAYALQQWMQLVGTGKDSIQDMIN